MGGRLLPIDCDDCGGVMDWGDFGGEDPPSTPTCACPTVTLDGALAHLTRAARATATELEHARARIAELEQTVANAWADIDTLMASLPADGVTGDEVRAKYADEIMGRAR